MIAPPKRILVVEQSVDFARTLQTVLQDAGYDARWVIDSSAPDVVVAEIGRQQPDLLALSLHSAGPDRFALLDALRADPVTRHIPILVMTIDKGLAGAALASANVREIMVKPFELSHFTEQVERALLQPAVRAGARPRSRRSAGDRAAHLLAVHSREAMFLWVQRLLGEPHWRTRPEAKLGDVLASGPVLVAALSAGLPDADSTNFAQRSPQLTEHARQFAQTRRAQGVPWDAFLREIALLHEEIRRLLVRELPGSVRNASRRGMKTVERSLHRSFERVVLTAAQVYGETRSDRAA